MDVIGELRKWGIEPIAEGPGKIRISCPLPGHEDKHPSCLVRLVEENSFGEGSYFCSVCGKGGDWFDLLSKVTSIPASAWRKQSTEKRKKVSPKKVEAYYANLMLAGHKTAASQLLKRQLEIRGLSDETIKKYMLGYNAESRAITIPVQWGDAFVNVLNYSPGADTRKFTNYAKGYGDPVIYPQDQLSYKKIILCGGPIKALVVAQHMNKLGIGAVSLTCGESKIPAELIPWFGKKHLWVCYDIDSHGRKFSDITCGMISRIADFVGNVVLPLDQHIYPKGDLNDYFGPEEATAEEFLEILNNTPQWVDKLKEPQFSEEFVEVNIDKLVGFTQAFNFTTSAYLSGVDDSAAHKIPKQITVSCTGDSEVCSVCKLMRSGTYDPAEGIIIDVEPRNPLCLGFVGIAHRMRHQVFKEYFGIPELCNKTKFEPSEELYTIRYVLLSDTQTDSEVPVSAAIITDGGELYSGEVCKIKGRVDQSPLTSEEVRIVTEHEPKDILTQYIVKNTPILEVFRPEDNSIEALQAKIDDINLDLERNVTFIYDRPQVHTLFDLCFHSPLWVPYENSVEPGWVSVLLVSETAQGKSTIMRRLISHYGHGTFIDAANTSVAGLVGGIKSIGKRQFVKWGILPQMDKRLVCIEEYANAPVELLRSMRAARDSGVVSMNKIDKGKAKARTRTIVLSNPKKLLKPNIVIDGVSLLEDLVERPEDLRRFDVGMWIPRIEIDAWYEAEEPKYSSEACHELITWAWTVPVERITYTNDAIEAIRNNEMKDKYPFLYLVGMREFDVKLARLSAAIACRTYNVINDKLVVELRHVEWVCNFLQSLYDDIEFGYNSRVRREADMDKECTIDQVISAMKLAGNPMLLVEFLNKFRRYTQEDLRAAVGDPYTFEQVKNKLIILGCIVAEEDTKWNNAYLATKRLKKVLEEVDIYITRQYSTPRHMKKGAGSI